MTQFAEAIPHVLVRIFVPTLGVCLVAWLIALFVQLFSERRNACRFPSAENGKGALPRARSGESAVSPRCGLGKPVWAGLAALAIACTALCGKNTGGVQNVGGGHLFQFNPSLVQAVSLQDVSNGWRVVEETEAESFAHPSANATTNETWRRRGAFDDAFRIPANGWSYPYATGVSVLARGELRTGIRAHDFPPAFAQGLSLLPLVSRPQLPEGWRESVFWHDTTPSNTLLTTWWNAVLGRDAASPVNFQAELFPDGGFTYRYEDRTVRHARVWPFDWDGDGLENSVDPHPLTPGPDAHGTNAEWYNTVCSNVFSAVAGGGTGTTGILPVDGGALGERALPWREGVNSNAYYFVDVVTERGPAPIYFTGDCDSRLGNPVVVARALETNRVPLLVGIDYAITSPVPFAVSFPVDDMYLVVETNEACRAHVRWPLNFVFTESIGASNRVYAVTVEPYDPGGVFEWGNSGGGGLLCGASSYSGCGCVSYRANSATFTCTSTCTCGGGCKARGRYLFELAEFVLDGGECRCGFDDPPGVDAADPPGTDDPPSLSITFSKEAVIFEDAYEDYPGMAMPRRSTRVRLTIDAYGGPDGGSLSLSGTGFDKLAPVDGGVALPYNQQLAGEAIYHASGVYEGIVASGREGDVIVSGSFIPRGQGYAIETDARLTVVRVELKENVGALANPFVHRRLYGIAEEVQCIHCPSAASVRWRTVGNGSFAFGATNMFYCPLTAEMSRLYAEYASASFPLALNVIEPERIACEYAEYLPPTDEMGCGMSLYLVVCPFTVSFSNLKIQEIPADLANWQQWGSHSGYFSDYSFYHRWCHTVAWGAGIWHQVDSLNSIGFDTSRMWSWPQPWSAGTLSWTIPYGWKHKDSESTTPEGQINPPSYSVWTMRPNFLEKTKHSHRIGVTSDGQLYFEGKLQNGNQ